MSPTSYQAAPPRVRRAHYRQRAPGLSMRTRTGGGWRAAVVEQEEDFAGAREAELLAGDLLDAVGIALEIVDVPRQAVVGRPEIEHLHPEPGEEAPLPVDLDQPHVAEQGIEQERQGDEPEEDEEGLAPQIDRRRLLAGGGHAPPPWARADRPG